MKNFMNPRVSIIFHANIGDAKEQRSQVFSFAQAFFLRLCVKVDHKFKSGFPGPKCLSITIGSVVEALVICTPAIAAFSLTKN